MRFTTIWTLRHMSLGERFRRTGEWALHTIGSKLPVRMRYFITIGEIAKATTNSPNIPATPLEDILKNLDSGAR